MTQFCVTILNNGKILENGMHGGHVAGSYLTKGQNCWNKLTWYLIQDFPISIF